MMPTIDGMVKNNILWMVVCICSVKESLSPLLIAVLRYGKIAVARPIPKSVTATLWIFLAKLKAATPPSCI